jgi:ketosteroid isomerase-like protein
LGAAENKQLLQHLYEEIAKGNVQPLLESMADDIEWTIIGSTGLSGTYRGKQEVIERMIGPLGASLDGPVDFTFERFIAEGDHVVMQARGRATAKSGEPYNNTYCIVSKIVDGEIREMTDYVDTELITKALRV